MVEYAENENGVEMLWRRRVKNQIGRFYTQAFPLLDPAMHSHRGMFGRDSIVYMLAQFQLHVLQI